VVLQDGQRPRLDTSGGHSPSLGYADETPHAVLSALGKGCDLAQEDQLGGGVGTFGEGRAQSHTPCTVQLGCRALSTAERRNGEDGYGDLLELPRFGDAAMLIRDGPGARLLDDAVGFHKQNITLLLVYLGHSDGPADSGLRMCKPVRREA